ncbi:DUF3306 domain-containing protein [Primorskyibacter sp. S187A]|uniref:DUF3306 domain-containing protein n=1 Tax=Primorskyibacter sp. S187A TaxID=3415130 RepID=UPI003C7B8889
MMDFWARRKADVQAEAEARDAALQQEIAREKDAAQDAKSDEELLEELGLPEPESLDAEGDFKAFLKEGVPARLKTRALRRLWRVNPVLANLDGLVDYGEDFTDAATVIENMQTAYQVGKGMLKHVEELARQAEAKEAKTAPEGDETSPPDIEETPPAQEDATVATVEPEATPEREAFVSTEAAVTSFAEPVHFEDDVPAMAPPSRRRMSFTFDDSPA